MFGSPASPPQGDLTDMFGIKSPFWPPPWSLLILAAIGLIVWWYCKKHCINFYVLSLFTSSSLHHNNQENLKKYKKNNNKNVSINMSDGYEPVSSLLSTKKNRQSNVMFGSITALVAAFLVYAVLSDLCFKAQRFNAAVVEVGKTPPSSLPLGLPPPPIDILGEVAIEEASSEYEDISSSFSLHTPKALASFLIKDKAASLLRGATVQTYFGPVYTSTIQQEGGIEDGIVRVGTPEVASGSIDLLSSFKSGFHRVGLKGYDQMPFKFCGRVRTLFQYLGHSDGGLSSSAFFSMAPLKSKAVGFLSRATPVRDILENPIKDAATASESASDEFVAQTEDRVIGFVGNMDVGELKPDTSIKYASYTCPTDIHLWYKHPVDKDGDGQRLGGLTKWINRVLLASSNDTRDRSSMKVSEASGDWPYSTDKRINSYQDGAVYCLLKKASNPTTLGGLDVDSVAKKASLFKVFSDKCVGSDVSFLKNKAASFIKNRTTSLLSGATVQSNLDLQQQRGEDLDDDSLRVELPVEGVSGSFLNVLLPSFKSEFQVGFKGYDRMTPFDSDPSSVCVTVPSPISKEVRVGSSGLIMVEVSSSPVGLDESMKVQLHNPSLPWYLVLTMMTALILGAIFELNVVPKFTFALQRVRDMLVSRQSPRYSSRKNQKARQMSFMRLVQLIMLSITLSNVLMSDISAYALEIGENLSGDNLIGESGEHDPDDGLKDEEYEKVETEDHQGQNLINDVPDGYDTRSDLMPAVEKFEDLLPDDLYNDSEDDEFDMMIEEYEQEELDDRASDKAQLWPTESSVKSSDMALVEKGLSSSEMKELEDYRRQQLRGSMEGDVNHLAIIPRIVDFLQHRVDEAKALKNIILNGNVAEAAAALSMYFDNTQAVAKITSSVDEGEEHALDFPVATNDGEDQLHGRKLQAFLSEEMSPKELVDILHLNDDSIDEMEYYVDVMEDVERNLIPGSSRSKRSTQKISGAQGAPSFSMNNKFKKPKLPKLKVVEQLKAKRGIRGRRRLQEVAPQCREKCQSDDYKCNCKLLVDYARDLTWYDASVMFLGGYVQGDPDVDEYGDLNVDFISDIDMFDVRNQLPEKMQSIKDKANEADSNMSVDSCTALLSELHTACGAKDCTEPNMDSFQLSVNQVGSSVNTHIKLNVETIGEFYDFQRLTVRKDDTDNNQITNTPLNERRPVRCCRDDEPTGDEEIWYKSPIAVGASLADDCPFAWEQKWTGNVAIPALPPIQTVRMSPVNFFGLTTYLPPSGTYTVKAVLPPSIAQISGTSDLFYYSQAQTTGEIEMRLHIKSYTGTESNDCAGLMIRQSSAPGSLHFSILYCGDKRIRRVRRTTENGDTDSSLQTDEIEGDQIWLRITKRTERDSVLGITVDSFTAYTSSDGTDWTRLGAPWRSNQFRVGNSNFYVGVAVSRGILEASDFIINGAYALPNYLSSTPPAVDGYTSYNQRMCNNDNQFLDVAGVEEDEDGLIRVSSAQECASYCDESFDCVSFDFFGIYCRLSSSCEHFSQTDPNPASQWYFKNVAPPSYLKYAGRLCTTGSSNLASTNANSVQECANICSEDHECVSFAYPTTINDSTECRLSSTCHEYNDMSDDIGWNTYVKRDEDDDVDEDVCPFLPFAQAEEYCADAGGRLCTRSELEDGCASFMGCNFDTANVWSSTETVPMTCPATYQETCGDFVTAFESLYNGRNRTIFQDENPMRIDQSRPADSTNFTNVQFPFAYNWETPNEHGIVSINPSNAFEYSALSNNPEDLFCGVTQGPPSELAKACDASMEFLLGPGVSIGFLTSTANEVNDFDPDEPTPEPRWLTWYTNKTDTNSIVSFNEWTEAYLKIEDPRIDPVWMEDYLSIHDEAPFILSQSQTFSDTEIRSINEIYCVDKSISGDDQTLQFCQRAWLDDKTNRYPDMTWYKSIQYPSSDMAPYNETCEFSTCQEVWLENDLNPFSEDTNPGCHAFWGYCRGYDPSRYQCNVFWDYCRTEQDSRNPGWKYPRENCTDTSISTTGDIVTCPMEWLDNLDNPYTDEREQNESCYNFWNYCRNELDEINPDWEYPRPTCNDDNGIEIETCQEAWLDDEENPYDSTTDSECYEFWDFCRLELLTKHERYAWPLPAEPTVDDLLPGYCCLDIPTEDRTTKFWGDHYTAARSEAGMKCANRGFWYMGMSTEACHNGGGQFFRTACITLQRCIDARPRKGEDGYKDSFEEWVYENEVEIYDPSDQEQCEQARVALDYEPDYYNDYEVCETFEALLCDEFFEDLQFLEDLASNGPVKFEQVTYKDIEYPEDKPLFFQELPNEVPIKDPDIDGADPDGSTVLEVAKQTLGIVKGNAMDAINKFIDVKEAANKKAKAKCDTLKALYETAKDLAILQEGKCNMMNLVVGGVSNTGYNACVKVATTVWGLKKNAAKSKSDGCTVKMNFVGILSDSAKVKLWGVHYFFKVAYEAVDSIIFDWKIKETGKVEVRDYTKAIYDNTKGQFGWIHDALGVMTNNTINQHTQMREELQKRHQDITNDVNRYTTCMSNFLGIQIFNALPGTRTGPLSSTCRNILGVSGRRLEEGGADDDLSIEGFNLDVEFLPASFIGQQDTIIGNEEKIMKKEDEIIKKEDTIIKELGDVEKKEDMMISALKDIMEKLDMDPAVLDLKKKKPKAPKKPKQAKPSEDQEEADQEDADLFKRNLLAVEEVKSNFDYMNSQVKFVENKVDSIEGKIESMESKVESMESKVESMESKVDRMEKTMEEMKEMLSQLMMRGGADA